jgi:AcrR family transcriptional regulator
MSEREGGPFDADDDTREALMAGVFRALREHGYADLTIQRIGEASDRSPSLLYHHYDSKDEFLLSFLEHSLDRFEEGTPPREFDDAREHLDAILDFVFGDEGWGEGEGDGDLVAALLELRMQAAHDPAFREHFTRHDRVMREKLTAVVEDGVEEGVFETDDPEGVAALLQTTFNGVHLQSATSYDEGGIPAEDVRRQVEALVESRLSVGDA